MFWNRFFVKHGWLYGLGAREPFIRNKCPVINCELTNDIRRINESDLILIHAFPAFDPISKLPSTRGPNERWVYVQYESPSIVGEFPDAPDVFNFTSTYRIDADFADYYVTVPKSERSIRWEPNATFDPEHDFAANKIGLAAAVITRCNAPSRRDEYIKEMQRYMSVDVYGRSSSCRSAECPEKFRLDKVRLVSKCICD